MRRPRRTHGRPGASPAMAPHESASVAPALSDAGFLEDVRDGLMAFPKRLSCRWLYDDEGSRLFEAIMRLPEYYLARCEAHILETRAGDILRAMPGEPRAFRVVDLGAGNGAKARLLLARFLAEEALLGYVPVDQSGEALDRLARALGTSLPGLVLDPVRDDWLAALERPGALPAGRRLLLFLGSNIGNFAWPAAIGFLSALCARMRDGDALLIGFDLRKHPARILRAYSDAAGITARFNFNLLDRINRELGGRFRKADFLHRAEYHALRGEARSCLVARRPVAVEVEAAGITAEFRAGEALHVESSCKYSLEEIGCLARLSGFGIRGNFLDPTGSFADSLWVADGPPREGAAGKGLSPCRPCGDGGG